MGKVQDHANCPTCIRFEELMDKWELEGLTSDELKLVLDHMKECPLGQHSLKHVEFECALPEGSLQDWDWSYVPRPSAEAAVAKAKRRHEFFEGKPSKRKWEPLPFSKRWSEARWLDDHHEGVKSQRPRPT